MANLLFSKDGQQFYEMEDTPESREEAASKGYRQYVDIVHPEKGEFTIEADTDTLQEAVGKGYSIKGVEVPKVAPISGGTTTEALALGTLGGYTLGAGEAAVRKATSPEVVEALKKEHPVAYTAGQVAGTIASPVSIGNVLLKGLGKYAANTEMAGKIAKLVKDSSFLQKLVTPAKLVGASGQAATQAGIDTAVQSTLEGKPIEQIKADVETAIKVGGGLGFGGKAVAEATELMGKGLVKGAEKTKQHLVGLDTKEVQKAIDTFGKDKEALFETAKQYDLIPKATQGYPKVAEKATEAVDKAKEALDNTYSALDSKMPEKIRVGDFLDQFEDKIRVADIKLIDPDLRSSYKKTLERINILRQTEGDKEGFQALREIKNRLYDQARKARGVDVRENLRGFAGDFDKMIKDTVKQLPEELSTEWQKGNDELSKLITLEDALYRKAGKELPSDRLPLHKAGWATIYAASGRPGKAAAALIPDITSPRIKGTIAAGKEALGKRLQKPIEAENLAAKLARQKALRDEDNTNKTQP